LGIQAPRRGGLPYLRESFGPITAPMIGALQRMRLWALWLAGWCLLAAGLLIFAGAGFLLGKRAVPGLPAGAPAWPVAVVSLLAAAAAAILAVPVFRFARSLTWVGGPDGEREIEWALHLHRTVWRLLGILAPSLFAVALIASFLTSPRGLGARRTVPRGLRGDGTPRFEDLATACVPQGAAPLLCTAVVRYDGKGKLAARGDWVVLRGAAVKISLREVGGGGDGGIGLDARVPPGNDTWSIVLGPPQGRPLLKGLYTGAEADRRHPRLEVSLKRPAHPEGPHPGSLPALPLAGEACPNAAGRFRIDRLSWSAQGAPQAVQADFERVCPDPQGFWVVVGRIAVRPPPEKEKASGR
jgi:hypothetical protein